MRRLEDNINMDLKKTCFQDGKWMELAQDCVQWWTLVLLAFKPSGSVTFNVS